MALVVARGCDMAFTGPAIVGFVGLVLETRRRGRGPGCWGPGRWAWAFAGIYLLANVLLFHVDLAPWNWRSWLAHGVDLVVYFHIFNKYCTSQGFVASNGGMSLAVALAVAWWAGALRDPAPDAREWAGRAFAFVVLVATLSFRVAFALQV